MGNNKTIKRVYISGPMRGLPDHNRRAFTDAEMELLDSGYAVINPVNVMSVLKPTDTTDEEYLSVDLFLLDMCDAVYMLDGWQESQGATAEYQRAKTLGLEIMHEPEYFG